MTTGQIIFYCGLGLLGATAVLAVIFWIKKPRYTPENAVYEGGGQGTQRLISGYPTDPLTIRKDPPAEPTETASGLSQAAAEANMPTDAGASIPETTPIQGVGTAALQDEIEEVKIKALNEANDIGAANKPSKNEQQTALL